MQQTTKQQRTQQNIKEIQQLVSTRDGCEIALNGNSESDITALSKAKKCAPYKTGSTSLTSTSSSVKDAVK